MWIRSRQLRGLHPAVGVGPAQVATVLVLAAACQPSLGSHVIEGDPPLATWALPGEAEDRLLVVVHGGPGMEHSYLRPEMDALTAFGGVVYYDQRGCGESGPAKSYGWQDHVGDLRRVIDFHRRGREVVLVGSSFGSVLIGQFLGQYPELVRAAVISGLVQAPIAPDLEEQLGPLCEEANRLGIKGLQDAKWTGQEFHLVPTLVFDDSGLDGELNLDLRSSGLQRRVHFPGHDPWFSRPEQYFAVVGRFLDEVEEDSG